MSRLFVVAKQSCFNAPRPRNPIHARTRTDNNCVWQWPERCPNLRPLPWSSVGQNRLVRPSAIVGKFIGNNESCPSHIMTSDKGYPRMVLSTPGTSGYRLSYKQVLRALPTNPSDRVSFNRGYDIMYRPITV